MKSFLLVLLLLPLAAAAPTGEQPSLSTENILSMDTSGNLLIAGWEDNRSPFEANSAVNTWSIWDNGVRVRTGASSEPNCNQFSSCLTTIVGVAVAGNRFVVASNDEGLNPSGRLLMGTTTQGITQRVELPLLQAFSVSEDGSKVVVAVAGTSFAPSPTLRMFHWVGTNPGTLTLQWNKALSGAAHEISVGDSGEGAVFTGTRDHVRFSAIGELRPFQTTSAITDLRFGEGSWSLAGLEDGRVLLFGANSNTSPYAPVLELHPFDDAITTVEWASPSSYFVGDAAGRLTHYWNTEFVSVTDEVRWQTTGAAVVDVEANADFLFVARANGISFGDLEKTAIWSKNTVVTELALSGNGYAAATTATSLLPFRAVRDVLVTVPEFTVQTGGSSTEQLRIANAGNREQTVDLTIITGSGWQGTVASSVTVKPNSFVDTPLTLTASSTVTAGNTTAVLTIGGNGLSPSEATVKIGVPGISRWDLIADSARAQGANPGEEVQFDFHIRNKGNEAISPDITLSSLSGWAAQVALSDATLAPGDEAAGNLTVGIPLEAQEGDEATFFVAMEGDVLEFQVIVGAFYGVELEIPGFVPQLVAGASHNVTLKVTNTGNGQDSFRLHVAGLPNDWNITYAPEDFLLVPAGETISVIVEVETSAASPAANYKATLQVTSIGDTRFFDSGSVLFPLSAATASSSSTESKSSPAPAVLPLLGVAALLARRKHR